MTRVRSASRATVGREAVPAREHHGPPDRIARRVEVRQLDIDDADRVGSACGGRRHAGPSRHERTAPRRARRRTAPDPVGEIGP